MEKDFLSKIFRFFTSLRLAVILLILIAFTSIIGTVIVQNAAPDHYIKLYSLTTYKIMRFLGFFDFYHSFCFRILLAMLTINLLFCSLKRLPSVLRVILQPNMIKEAAQIKGMKQFRSYKTDMEFKKVVDKIKKIIISTFSKPESISKGDNHFFYAAKGKFCLLGAYITHLSIIIILIGAIVGSVFGYRGNINIKEGESKDKFLLQGTSIPKKLGFQIRCDNFEVTYYPNRAPKEYKSTVTILKNGKEVFTDEIKVNHPLKYQGIYFYQSSFGTIAKESTLVFLVTSKKQEDFKRIYRVKEGEKFIIPETNFEVTIERFFPDFILNENGRAFSRSNELNNPAAYISIKENGVKKGSTWAFARFSDFHGTWDGEFKFQLKDLESREYTGLQITKDPGIWIVWTGFIVMVMGIMTAFFFSHRRIWVKVEKGDKSHNILIGGIVNRNPWDFEREFQNLVKK
ncbi:MAG: cytochrome c biogenesis protein ResB, partial [Thermodesulfobacteriota bacterium]|nr:cytochrome c biogenesis protein ResB [Thermodesulfobacteriota bacterium]